MGKRLVWLSVLYAAGATCAVGAVYLNSGAVDALIAGSVVCAVAAWAVLVTLLEEPA